MRTAFIKALLEMAERDQRVYLLTGDMGYSVFEEFEKRYPDRYINAGIAEGNMIGFAAGLALNGKVPYVYSIIPFVTMRGFEQIRIDIAYQNLNVNLVGVGGGFSYGPLATSHHSIEDIAIMRVLPNMNIFNPGDPLEVAAVTEATLMDNGPSYIRLGKNGEKNVHKNVYFEKGKGIEILSGDDVTLLVSGNMLESALLIAEKLKETSIDVRLYSMPTVKPIDKEVVLNAIFETKAIFTIEEHNVIGGFGSAIAEIIAESGHGILFKRFGVPDQYPKVVGDQQYLREHFLLDVQSLYHSIIKLL